MTTESTGEDLRDVAIETVIAADEAVHRGYRPAIEKALSELIDEGKPFTADTVNERLDEDVRTHASPMLVPALFRAAAQAGHIRAIGWAISTRPKRHKGVLRIWLAADTEEAA